MTIRARFGPNPGSGQESGIEGKSMVTENVRMCRTSSVAGLLYRGDVRRLTPANGKELSAPEAMSSTIF